MTGGQYTTIPLTEPGDAENTIVLTYGGAAMAAENATDVSLIVPTKVPDLIRYGGNFAPPTEEESKARVLFTVRRHTVCMLGSVPEMFAGMIPTGEHKGTLIVHTPGAGRTVQISPYGGFIGLDAEPEADHHGIRFLVRFFLPYRAFAYGPDGRRSKDVRLTRGQAEFVAAPYLAGPNDRINLRGNL